MEVQFYITNQSYSYSFVSSFDVKQNKYGDWVFTVDDKVVYEDSYAPSKITVNKE